MRAPSLKLVLIRFSASTAPTGHQKSTTALLAPLSPGTLPETRVCGITCVCGVGRTFGSEFNVRAGICPQYSRRDDGHGQRTNA